MLTIWLQSKHNKTTLVLFIFLMLFGSAIAYGSTKSSQSACDSYNADWTNIENWVWEEICKNENNAWVWSVTKLLLN